MGICFQYSYYYYYKLFLFSSEFPSRPEFLKSMDSYSQFVRFLVGCCCYLLRLIARHPSASVCNSKPVWWPQRECHCRWFPRIWSQTTRIQIPLGRTKSWSWLSFRPLLPRRIQQTISEYAWIWYETRVARKYRHRQAESRIEFCWDFPWSETPSTMQPTSVDNVPP